MEPRTRLASARTLTPSERQQLLTNLGEPAPIKPWPNAMPTSVNPLVVVLGLSPGNSPNPADADLGLHRKPYDLPTIGTPHPGIWYQDTKHYWDKLRLLYQVFLRRWDATLSDDECLALAGHLNLGTGSFGQASIDAMEAQIVPWVSHLLHAELHPRVVVCVGLGAVLRDPGFRSLWQEGGFAIDWTRPDAEAPLDGYAYRFRFWRCGGRQKHPVAVLAWPNHPSRHPFAGPPTEGSMWHRSVAQASRLLTNFGF